MEKRIAFYGCSGSGKTTLAEWLAEKLGVPFNPVGARSVAKEMGFDSPYDVDAAGKRAEFQELLLRRKAAWEQENDSFVTDRTTLDTLTYMALHDIYSVTEELFDRSVKAMHRYTHVIYCPYTAFCNPAGDTNRVQDMMYHRIYDRLVLSLVRPVNRGIGIPWKSVLHVSDLEKRKAQVWEFVNR